MPTESFFTQASLAYLASAGAGKDGKTYSMKPTDGTGDFTFSRGSNLSATRVGADGLIEKGRENLFAYSNDFSDATWAKSSVSVTSGQTGYDGSSDAWLLEKSASNGTIIRFQSLNSVQTISFYAKANTLNWLRLRIGTSGGNAYFDLQNGVTGSSSGISSAIESVGNGWYRCSLTDSNSSNRYRIYPADNNNSTSGTSGSIYIQDAQLEIGLVATDYIESGASTGKAGLLEDEPRFDYSGGATCPSLLLEPQRTNLFTQSEYFSGWSTIENATITEKDLSSIEGLQNAAKITDNATSGNHRIFQSVTTTAASHTFSIFLKKGTMTTAFLRFYSGSDIATANVDLDAGTITATAGSATIEDYGNDWYRCSITGAAAAGTSDLYVYMKQISSYSGSGQDMYLYGAQVEAGSYPTSYIPTYGSSVTRGADDSVATGLGSIAGQSEGTLFAYFKTIGDSGTPYISLNQNNDVSNRVLIYNNSGIGAEVRVGGSVQASITSSTQGLIKAAIAYKANDFVFYINGSQIGTDSSGSTFGAGVLEQLNLGFGAQDGAEINQVLLFDTRLSNADLATLTTI